MNKKHYLIFSALLLTTCLVSCNDNIDTNQNSESITTDDSSSITDTNVFDEDMYYKDEIEDNHYHSDYSSLSAPVNELENMLSRYFDNNSQISFSDITYGDLYINGIRQENIISNYGANDDSYYMLYGNNSVRAISRANGYALTLPTSKIVKPDLSVAQYKSQFETKDYILSISKEDKNPYGSWGTYHTEWLTRYLVADGSTTSNVALNNFFKYNNLSYTRDPGYTSSLLSGFEVEYISILINDNENIEMPYYNIAIVKKPTEIKNFYLLVMKSKEDMSSQFDSIISSMKFTNTFGMRKGNQDFDLKVPSYLNEETQRYYKKLMEQNYTEWGIFNHSLNDSGTYNSRIKSKMEAFESKEQMDYKFGIHPTYTHIGKPENPTSFPVKNALEFAGGNGFDDKPVIQFTLQYTSSNNLSLYGYTPMYDIIRGKYDEYFRQLASDIKTYGKPVLFRLNNEMNSDWVSYCGQVTLLDTDIFIMTWERMARIFKEEGVGNVLYIFNPTAKSYPYCNWGEDLCYLPSLEYVQLLGLTYYEYNNYVDEDPVSFYELYKWLDDKNSPYWDKYPAIISEFGCGSGGNYTPKGGQKYRNATTQAYWVLDMFDYLNYGRNIDFINQIKGAVWFNANDEVGNYINNLLIIDNINTPLTIAAFKEGLAGTKEIKDSN